MVSLTAVVRGCPSWKLYYQKEERKRRFAVTFVITTVTLQFRRHTRVNVLVSLFFTGLVISFIVSFPARDVSYHIVT